ncbi:curli assembly protein CsgF [Devosia rhodophyticola]|uniref:Curli production assembly/transport component CsgF n=1 Tax=Devosia rhodophyticola TaxID=3026423 RepID=A0ABY7Z1L0_9HYPH|nr:curli assembly protein CsgF [Devosia rhodophyticola]WDR07568.1 curli assembly protein CsgF [Devosia rhodophyticola]
MVSVAAISCSTAMAADLVYTPINPTFGGNPGNSSHLLSIAGAQKTATASDAPVTSTGGSGTSGSGSSSSNSGASLFVSQLQGRLLSALASQVTDAIFGTNPQNHGTVTFGDTTVVFDNTGSAINLTITDPTGVTIISVPQLVVTP